MLYSWQLTKTVETSSRVAHVGPEDKADPQRQESRKSTKNHSTHRQNTLVHRSTPQHKTIHFPIPHIYLPFSTSEKARSDRQEESDRSNQGVASPDYAEMLITHHANSNHHVLSALQKEEQVRIIPPDDTDPRRPFRIRRSRCP